MTRFDAVTYTACRCCDDTSLAVSGEGCAAVSLRSCVSISPPPLSDISMAVDADCSMFSTALYVRSPSLPSSTAQFLAGLSSLLWAFCLGQYSVMSTHFDFCSEPRSFNKCHLSMGCSLLGR